MSGTVIVTDSTASIPPELAAARGIVVVPLQVVIGAQVLDEGADGATPDVVAQALADFVPVSTSRPNPASMAEVYERLAREGADEIVSVHISGDMSGTFESAQLASAQVSVPVTCVDSRQVGAATGYAALSAADTVDAGGSASEAAQAARERAASATSLFYVDTLEYLRRGGRIGAAAAILGGALSVKPLLSITDGKVANLERVRTGARALARLEDLAVEAAGEEPVDVYVAHLANAERAEQLASKLADRLVDNLEGREIWCGELGAVLGAHVGPGMVAVCVAPRLG
ncbi:MULTISPECIES: DegV family protein [Nocardioides]|uniref:DegV family protein n=1 Tax=Nocardioides TaxID=1839 RepID=UPI00032E5A88|nr:MULTISPECIES: DegV family protein [Nocardioides]EON24505.1 degV family protein [Nocardioides sp. CF8]